MVRLIPGRRRDTTAGLRPRRHRVPLRQLDRQTLERRGWRTTLELRENHVRTSVGRLVEVEAIWVVEAERATADSVEVIAASGKSEAQAWARLLGEASRMPQRLSMEGAPGGIRVCA